ncbi:MAG: DNA repair ATPase, partial [Gammaproteobacteria bacterium]|nr:DNA repair ATPase [Gammaproteobacteria bacterium]
MNQKTTHQEDQVEQAVAQGGAYELIAKRLNEQAKTLHEQIESLNGRRIDEFGQADLEVISRVRVRTDNNCIPRDIIRVGKYILFAYNVHLGLKNDIQVHDVFNLYMLKEVEQNYEINEIPLADTFLADESFQRQFNELYSYYKSTTLTQLYREKNRFYAVFKIGRNVDDIRVFRWMIDNSGHVSYIDDRGEREIPELQAYDFEWKGVTRDDHVSGQYAHINILDTIFVETMKGDLTIKIENNTATGEGIYSEPVEERNQSLSDIELYYAHLGDLILIKIKPYREENFR